MVSFPAFCPVAPVAPAGYWYSATEALPRPAAVAIATRAPTPIAASTPATTILIVFGDTGSLVRGKTTLRTQSAVGNTGSDAERAEQQREDEQRVALPSSCRGPIAWTILDGEEDAGAEERND